MSNIDLVKQLSELRKDKNSLRIALLAARLIEYAIIEKGAITTENHNEIFALRDKTNRTTILKNGLTYSQQDRHEALKLVNQLLNPPTNNGK